MTLWIALASAICVSLLAACTGAPATEARATIETEAGAVAGVAADGATAMMSDAPTFSAKAA